MDEKCMTFEESENASRLCEYSQLHWVECRLEVALKSRNVRSEIKQLLHEVQSEMDDILGDIRDYSVNAHNKKGEQ